MEAVMEKAKPVAGQKPSPANSPSRQYPMERTRNIGIAAHIDAGKTTTTERILFYTGLIHKMGDVDDGNTVTDWMEQERERGITITSAATTCYWTQKEDGTYKAFNGVPHRVNIIDTPGHVDFTAEVERSMRVLDGAVAVFCGVAGVQPQSETVWRQATKYKVPRIAFVNKMDRTGANFENALNDMRKKLGAYAYPIFLPVGKEDTFRGVVDVVNQKAIVYDDNDEVGLKYQVTDIPDDLKDSAKAALAELIDAVSNKDDTIAEMVIENKPISPEVLKAAIRRLTCKIELVPSCAVPRSKSVASSPWWTQSWIICRRRWTFPRPPALRRAPKTKSKSLRTTTPSSARSRSSSGPILTSASWCSSASIAANSKRVTPFTIPARASANA